MKILSSGSGVTPTGETAGQGEHDFGEVAEIDCAGRRECGTQGAIGAVPYSANISEDRYGRAAWWWRWSERSAAAHLQRAEQRGDDDVVVSTTSRSVIISDWIVCLARADRVALMILSISRDGRACWCLWPRTLLRSSRRTSVRGGKADISPANRAVPHGEYRAFL